jgi:hypothetical protein
VLAGGAVFAAEFEASDPVVADLALLGSVGLFPLTELRLHRFP